MKWRLICVIVIVIVSVAAVAGCRAEVALSRAGSRRAKTASCTGTTSPRPGRVLGERYPTAKRRLSQRRAQLAKTYQGARGQGRKSAVLNKARSALEQGLLQGLIPHWCGTRWAYHGTSQTPGQGTIACGYFVSTLLEHAGFKLSRVSLARRPSEAIIKSLTSERYIQRFSNAPINVFVQRVRTMGNGLHIVGLDNHVGFLVVLGARVTFLHSTYLKPGCVVEEEALRSEALVASKYRVVGHISADPELLRAWLTGKQISTL